MKTVITSALLVVTLGLGACASTPLPGMGTEIKASADAYGDYSKDWNKAAKAEQKALELIETGEKRIARNEKKIRDANKDIRDAEKAIERGEGEIRKGTRDAESAKARRIAIESDYKDAARIDDERAAEESVS